jgi:hypothetical protein
MLMRGKLFNGAWGTYWYEDKEHARHLLMNETCMCKAINANGKFLFKPTDGYALYVWPDDIIEEIDLSADDVKVA